MKIFSRNGIGQFIFFLLAVGSTYCIGQWHGRLQASMDAENRASSQRVKINAGQPSTAGGKTLTLDETRQRLLDILAGHLPEAMKNKWDYLDMLKEIDPAEIPSLIAALTAQPASRDKNAMITALLRNLADTNPDAALSLAEKFTDPALRTQAQVNILAEIALVDPQQALTALAKLPPGSAALMAYAAIFSTWAQQNPAEAALAALNLPPGTQRDNALGGVARAWAISDPVGALNWALSLAPSEAGAVKAVIMTVAQSDPQLAAANLDKLTDPAARNQAIGVIANNLSRTDPAGTLAWLQQVATGSTYDEAVKNIFSSFTGSRLADGAALLTQVTDQADRNSIIAILAKNWGSRNPADALAWVTTLPETDGDTRTTALLSIVTNWGKNDPAAAIQYIQSAADPSVFLPDAPALAKSFAASDPNAAFAWVSSLPDGTAKDQAVSNVLATLAQSDFPSAWTDALALPDGAGRNATMVSLIDVKAKQDPAQAAAMLDQFSTTDAPFQNASRDVTYAWVRQDPQAVSTWINTLPDGAERNGAIIQMVNYEATKDPTGSLTWANSITWQQGRINEIQRLFNEWAKTDPEGALNALPSANIPQAQRDALQQKINQLRVTAKSP